MMKFLKGLKSKLKKNGLKEVMVKMANGNVSLINGHIDEIDEVNDEVENQGGEENVDG